MRLQAGEGLHGDPHVPFALKLRFGQGLDCIILTNEALVKLVLRSTIIYIYIYIYVCMYVCMYIYIYMCVYIYIY